VIAGNHPEQKDVLLRNKALPDHLRQCSVVLLFHHSIPRHQVEHFYRIRMSRRMLDSGEGDFWMPELLQPGRTGPQKCLACGHRMRRVGALSTVCTNDFCQNAGILTINGPRRGVHRVAVEFDADKSVVGGSGKVKVSFIVGREWLPVSKDVWINVAIHHFLKDRKINQPRDDSYWEELILRVLRWPENKIPVDMVNGCLLILDRRYPEECLKAVWRTAGLICDEMGWRMY